MTRKPSLLELALAEQSQFSRTFLIVDDEPDILDSIRRLFRKQYRVLTAQSAEEAFGILETEDIQVVMTDQRMPRMSGVDFLARLRATHPDVIRVLLTGYSNIDHVVDAINEGHVYRYISKPWNPAELRLFVAQAFEYYESRKERKGLLSEVQMKNQMLAENNVALLKANEDLKTLDRVKSVFMEVVSHELNTPVAVILGYEFLLRRELENTEDEVVTKALAGIQSSANRLKNISARIFKMLQNKDPKMALDLEEVVVSDLIGEIERYTAPFLVKREQTLLVNVAESVSAFSSDKEKVMDILINLLMNAIKFSHDGGEIRLDVTTDGETLCFRLSDDGIGIKEEDIAQIFAPFFSTFSSQYHSSGEFEFGKRGIGLGLSLAKRFTEMHGGFIEVESGEGKGTTFSVHLPLAPKEFDSSDEHTPLQH